MNRKAASPSRLRFFRRMLLASAVAFSVLVAAPTPARADPVTAAIANFLFNAGLSAIGMGGTWAIASLIVNSALMVGLQYAQAALAGKVKPETSGIGRSGQLQTSGIVPRSFILGRGATDGSLVYANTWGMIQSDSGDTPNAYLAQVIALSDLPVEGLAELWVDGVKVTYDPVANPPDENGNVAIPEYHLAGRDNLWIRFYDGTQTTADARLVELFSADEHRPYEATRVGTGVAYAVVKSRLKEQLWTGFPQFRFVLDGIPLYDPREDTEAGGDGDQEFGNPATYAFSRNPIVGVYNILRGIQYNGEWFYGGQTVTAPRVPFASAAAAMNECDADADLPGGGTEPQFVAGGEIFVSAQPIDAIEELLKSCNGRMAEIGGSYKFHVGAAGAAVLAITDEDIIVTEQQTFNPFPGFEDTANGISAKYPSPEEAWNLRDAPQRLDAAFEAADGGRRSVADVQYNFVSSGTQVQRLTASALAEGRNFRRHTIVLPPETWRYEPAIDVFAWTSARNGYTSKLFRVLGARDRANLDMEFDIVEVNPADYDPPQFITESPGSTGIVPVPAQPIVGWTAQGILVQFPNGQRRAECQMGWSADVDDVVGVRFQIRRKADGFLLLDATTDRWDEGNATTVANLASLTEHQARGKYIPASERETEYSDWLDFTTPDARITQAEMDAATNALLNSINERIAVGLERVRKEIGILSSALGDQVAGIFEQAGQIRIGAGAQYLENSASIEQSFIAIADVDQSIAALITSVNAQFGDVNADIEQALIAIADVDEALVSAINSFNAQFNDVEADIQQNVLAIAAVDSALASAITSFNAQIGDLSAQGLIRFSSAVTPAGVAASVAIEVRATTLDDFAFAGFYIDAGVTALGGASRIRLVAGSIQLENPVTGQILDALLLQVSDEPPLVPIVSGTLTVNLSTRQRAHRSFLTTDVEIKFPFGARPGLEWTHTLEQDGTGGHTVSFDEDFFLPPHPVVSENAGDVTVLNGEVVRTSQGVFAIMSSGGAGQLIPPEANLYNILIELGLQGDLLSCYDAGSEASWDAVVDAANWRDLTGTFRHWRLAGTNPNFVGTEGGLSINEYFENQQADDFFEITFDTAPFNLFHQNGAAFTIVALGRVATGSNRSWTIFQNIGSLASNTHGIELYTKKPGLIGGPNDEIALKLDVRRPTGSGFTLEVESPSRTLASTFAMFSCSLNETQGTNGLIFGVNNQFSLHSSTYSSPTGSAAGISPRMFRAVNNGANATGPRVGRYAIWSRALSVSELTSLHTRASTAGWLG